MYLKIERVKGVYKNINTKISASNAEFKHHTLGLTSDTRDANTLLKINKT